MIDPIFPLYKPSGPTSHDIVSYIRRITGVKKVGHAGTLDPLAKGVLVIGVGMGTKKLGQLTLMDKEYVAVIRLGTSSTTDDEEGLKTTLLVTTHPSRTHIDSVLAQFVGNISQIPPQYSAIKIKGKTAYSYARKGQTVTLKPRPVQIHSIVIQKYLWPNLKIKIVCGSGVYIRSLARDIGRALGVSAYLHDLERTRVGHYTTAEAMTLEQLTKIYDPARTQSAPNP